MRISAKLDVRTVAGRRAFDVLVREELDDKSTMSVSDVAAKMGVDELPTEAAKKAFKRMVGTSLKRGARAGLVEITGKGSWQRYRRV